LSVGAQECDKANNQKNIYIFFSGSFGKCMISFGDLPGAFFSLSLDLIEKLENRKPEGQEVQAAYSQNTPVYHHQCVN